MSEWVNFGEGTAERGSPLRAVVAITFADVVREYRSASAFERLEILEWLRSGEAAELARFIGLPAGKLADRLAAGAALPSQRGRPRRVA